MLVCLILSDKYIENHFDRIRAHASDVERRLDDSDLSKEMLMDDNRQSLESCTAYGLPHILIEEDYNVAEQIGGILCPM